MDSLSLPVMQELTVGRLELWPISVRFLKLKKEKFNLVASFIPIQRTKRLDLLPIVIRKKYR